MAPATAEPFHPYFDEIGRRFYNYRLAQLNRRYYSALLARTKRWNLWAQIFIGVFSASAAALIGLAIAFHPSVGLLGK
jgi:NADH/NAD ratio-sensing transcriptional regulator Rex